MKKHLKILILIALLFIGWCVVMFLISWGFDKIN